MSAPAPWNGPYGAPSCRPQVGVATMPVVSGNGLTPEAVDSCREMQVWQLIYGGAIEPAAWPFR